MLGWWGVGWDSVLCKEQLRLTLIPRAQLQEVGAWEGLAKKGLGCSDGAATRAPHLPERLV